MRKQPLVSVCIPTYNGEKYIQEAIASVIHQTYSNLEIIVSDNISQDETLSRIKDIKSSTNIPIHIYSNEEINIGNNWNNCLKHSNGEYIKFLFQDDVLKSTCISELLNVLLLNPEVGLASCRRQILIEEDSLLGSDFLAQYRNLFSKFGDFVNDLKLDSTVFKNKNLLVEPINFVGEPSCVLFKKSLIQKTGFFSTQFKQILDIDFYFKTLKHSKIIIYNKELCVFRLHQNQATQKNIASNLDETHDLYLQIFLNNFWHLSHYNRNQLGLKLSKHFIIKFISNIFSFFKSIFR